jgi:hypothetical protein
MNHFVILLQYQIRKLCIIVSHYDVVKFLEGNLESKLPLGNLLRTKAHYKDHEYHENSPKISAFRLLMEYHYFCSP